MRCVHLKTKKKLIILFFKLLYNESDGSSAQEVERNKTMGDDSIIAGNAT